MDTETPVLDRLLEQLTVNQDDDWEDEEVSHPISRASLNRLIAEIISLHPTNLGWPEYHLAIHTPRGLALLQITDE